MKSGRTLGDLFSFSVFVAPSTLTGVFGDPKVRIVSLHDRAGPSAAIQHLRVDRNTGHSNCARLVDGAMSAPLRAYLRAASLLLRIALNSEPSCQLGHWRLLASATPTS